MNKDDIAKALMRKKLGEEMTHQPFQPMTPVEDTWSSMNTLQKVGMSPVGWPVTDVAGLMGDVQQMREDPSQRTPMNMGLSALGLLPFVPAGVTKVGKRAYENVPDSLMGFRRSGENKGFDEENYNKTIDVVVKWPDGTSHTDSIKGLNTPHALERARRNWEGAEIEEIGKVEPKFTSQTTLERMLRSENKGDAMTTQRIRRLQEQEAAGLISPGERHRALNRLTKSHKDFVGNK